MNEQLLEVVSLLEAESITNELLIEEHQEEIKALKEKIKANAKKIGTLKNMLEAN